MPVSRFLFILFLSCGLVLSGCESEEARVEKHYQRGVELLAAGDADRALIEFRNVLRLDGDYIPAREQYAQVVWKRGDLGEAFTQYQRLVELDPENAADHRNLTELALQLQDFETAQIHSRKAYALAPEDPMTRALKATVDFRLGNDTASAVAMAREVVTEAPATVPAHLILIAERLKAEDPAAALALCDAALAAVPDDEGLHLARLTVLEKLGDMAGIGAELKTMVSRFPDNDGTREALVQWYLQQDDIDNAEAELRAIAKRDTTGAPEPHLDVVAFLHDLRGADAARAELERLIVAAADPSPYQRALAELDFSEGAPEAGISRLRELLAGAKPSDVARILQVTLAEMLYATGPRDEAAGLLQTVLSEDRTHVAALKLRARMALDDDRPEDAVLDTRSALVQAPGDADIMTIMAMAYERAGSRDLMGERLAQAVELAQRAPAESLRYARFLEQEGRSSAAEGVLMDALRGAPANPDLLEATGQFYLEAGNWRGVDRVIDTLRGLDMPEAAVMADAFQSESLRRQGRDAERLDFLQGLAGQGNVSALTELVRFHLAEGDPDAADAALAPFLAASPDNRDARMLVAETLAARGDAAGAEAAYRALIAEDPGDVRIYQALFALLEGTDDAAAAQVLEVGIAAAAENGPLLFARAGLEERAGDLAAARADYETLYARDSGSVPVANNLASLLTTAGAASDPADLARAYAMTRRLRGTDVPPFQDTYGWILYLRGDASQALTYLEPAAAALPDVALVQYHLGEAELAAKRWDAAEQSFTRALEAAAAGSPLPQVDMIAERLQAVAAGRAQAQMPEPGGKAPGAGVDG